MQQPVGYTFRFSLTRTRSWLRLGPGWAVLAGALAGGGYTGLNAAAALQLLSVWLLVDPMLGTLWDLSVRQGLWRIVTTAPLPPPPLTGFAIPYARPQSTAGQLILLLRRYRLWWRESFAPEYGGRVTTFGWGVFLALAIAFFLGPPVFWLTVLAVGLTLLAGHYPPDLPAVSGGRWQTMVQMFLPWLIGAWLWSTPGWPNLALAVCYGCIYLGGLRMLGHHRYASRLFFGGQFTAISLLLALRLLPGAALLSVLLLTQGLILTKFNRPADFLARVQPYLVAGILAAALSAGTLYR